MDNKSCETCRYSKKHMNDGIWCHLNPPVGGHYGNGYTADKRADYPVVSSEDWCSHHRYPARLFKLPLLR